MSIRRTVLFLGVFLLLFPPSGFGQFGVFKKKKKEQETVTSTLIPQYSEKDLKKLEEIAQRPEVIERIERDWEAIRNVDMNRAYVINRTSNVGLRVDDRDIADFLAEYGSLYDNPILQNYVNSVGQRLVPTDSPNLFAFKLLLDPVPRAETLTNGTIYVSTGLVALLDNEAQLAYVLAHEIAHLENNHHYKELRQSVLEEVLWEEKQESAEKKAKWFTLATTIGGGIAGGLAKGANGAVWGSVGGLVGGSIASGFLFRNKFRRNDWSTVNEDEADEIGLELMIWQKYDAREVPKAYARLSTLVSRDARIGLGFMGNPGRVKARVDHVKEVLDGDLKSVLDQLLDEGAVGSTPNFSLLMAALKRDNGVIALDYDLYPMARANLEDALAIRSNDPRTHYYLGKVYAQTGREQEEKQQAINHFLKAIQYDAERGSYAEPHLQKALFLIDDNSPAHQAEIQEELKTYVRLYQRQHGGALPANMHIIYDYFLLSGESSYYVPPVTNISTEDIRPISVTAPGGGN